MNTQQSQFRFTLNEQKVVFEMFKYYHEFSDHDKNVKENTLKAILIILDKMNHHA